MTRMFNSIFPFFLPAGLIAINWLFLYHSGWESQDYFLTQIWAGALIVFGLAYACGFLNSDQSATYVDGPPRRAGLQPGRRISIWTLCWLTVWILLPTGGSLKVMSMVVFFALVWANASHGVVPFSAPTYVFRRAMPLVLTSLVVAMLFAKFFFLSPYSLQRLISDFVGPLEFQGRHYMHGQVMKTLWSLHLVEGSELPLPTKLAKLYDFGFLKIAGRLGLVAAALVAAMLIAAWEVLYRWVAAAKGGGATSRLRRLGLALIAMHASATLLSVLWNFGVLRQPFGSLAVPLTWRAPWPILSAAMLCVLITIYRQRRSHSVARNRLISAVGSIAYIGAIVSVAALLVVITDFSKRGINNGYPIRISKAQPLQRLDIVDPNGQRIAHTVTALDFWVVPQVFWGASLGRGPIFRTGKLMLRYELARSFHDTHSPSDYCGWPWATII